MRLLALLLIATLAAAAAADEPITPAEPTRLFNGKDLSGFHTWLGDTRREDPRRVFSVTDDGLLRISGDGFGYLSTDKPYRDYRLVAEFKWGTRNYRGREGKARDSGIFLHSAGPEGNSFDGDGAFKAAIECQVMQGAVGDLLLINGKAADGSRIPVRLSARAAPQRDADNFPTWDPTGQPVTLNLGGRLNWRHKDPRWQDVLDFRGPRDVESPGDDWTRIECVCAGDSVTVRVNNTVVNEATKVTPSHGPILLQCEGSEVFFRTLEVHPLQAAAPAEKPAPPTARPHSGQR